jgi:hypothetical protein
VSVTIVAGECRGGVALVIVAALLLSKMYRDPTP